MIHDIRGRIGAMVGFVLGLIRRGGSILAVALLVYVVGVRSGAFYRHQLGGRRTECVVERAWWATLGPATCVGLATWCAACGIIGAGLGSTIGKSLDGQRLLTLLGILMIVVALLMLQGIRSVDAEERDRHRDPVWQLSGRGPGCLQVY